MTQIRIFEDSDSEHGYCTMDDTVNKWLNDNSHRIAVRDIKLDTKIISIPERDVFKQTYTLMVIYDSKEKPGP